MHSGRLYIGLRGALNPVDTLIRCLTYRDNTTGSYCSAWLVAPQSHLWFNMVAMYSSLHLLCMNTVTCRISCRSTSLTTRPRNDGLVQTVCACAKWPLVLRDIVDVLAVRKRAVQKRVFFIQLVHI